MVDERRNPVLILGHSAQRSWLTYDSLCIRPVWTGNADYSLSLIFFKLHMSVVDYERSEPYWFWVTGVKGQGQLCHIVYKAFLDTMQTFVLWLSNFTCRFRMMRGGTLLILGHVVKGQGQLCHIVYKALLA